MALYLLHFDRPFKHARHYLGWSRNLTTLKRRVEIHRRATIGDGQHHSMMAAVAAAGIGFVVARVWPRGSRTLERQKKQRGHARQCPICRAEGKLIGKPVKNTC